MYRNTLLFIISSLLLLSCTEKNTYITSPEDWQPPVVSWRIQVDAEVRGTVGVDFHVTDSSDIAQVIAYLDGAPSDSDFTRPYRFELVTDSLLDGMHLLEIRATDEFGNLGISPILRINVSNSVAQGPQLIWVPDHYVRIQDAINAATDFDTIRVRDGTYYETLNTFGKGIWLESEGGPNRTYIDAGTTNNAIYLPSGSGSVGVRGFRLNGSGHIVRVDGGVMVKFLNNAIISPEGEDFVITDFCGGEFRNNLFTGTQYGFQIGYFLGQVRNNVFANVVGVAFWNAAIHPNPITYGYNNFWNNGANYREGEPLGPGDVFSDPRIDFESGTLLPDSPCQDSGDPTLLDNDSTRSDIGPFGGPDAY